MLKRKIGTTFFSTAIFFSTSSILPALAAQLNLGEIKLDGKSYMAAQTIKNTKKASVLLDFDRSSFQLEADIRLADLNSQLGLLIRADKQHSEQGYISGIDANQQVYLKTSKQLIVQKDKPIKAGQWYQLKLQVQNNHFVLYLGDQAIAKGDYPQYDAVDNTFSAGQLGFFATGNSADINNIRLSAYSQNISQVTYTNPVQLNCADPGLLKHQGTYYAYCTYTPDFPMMTRGIRLYTSGDLVNWQDQGFVLNNADSWGESRHWAPDVVSKNGRFYMYYAVDERIGVAEADSPMGPFKQKIQAPMQPDSIKIDAHVFIDDDGKQYFYYVGFDNGNHIWGAELNDDMLSVKQDSITHLIAPVEDWETDMANVAEGAAVLKHKGLYYMTYSGSHFESPHYSIGYAVAEHPLGPWKKYEHNPIMKSTSYAHGTAHHSLTTSPDSKEMFVVYHQHFSLNQTEPRKIAIDRIRFVEQDNGPDILQAWGPTITPQPLPSGALSKQ
jgi:GH43 family beta-xylosidase